jgi:dTDP-4-amino-4,6-dideoxygalactose transaminase
MKGELKKVNLKQVYVTQPALPPLDEFTEYLRQIWDSKILTNKGPFHEELEKALADYLGVKYISLFSNGTLALLTALQTLRITGEVITTPYSFVATTHALWWNNIKPVFADIEPGSFNLDPRRIEGVITPFTTAIMPVHVYGNPCSTDEIGALAEKYNLRVIYDSAHAFGVTVNGESILNFGDLSVLSFHATKTFNTFEGGAIVCHDEQTKKRIDLLKNFGFVDEVTVTEPGINAKMNELQASFGLLQLKYFSSYIDIRRAVACLYRELLGAVPGITMMNDIRGVMHNYSYFPIRVNSEMYGISRDELYEMMKEEMIFARRYFYPLISHFPIYKNLPSAIPANLPVAERVSSEVICLPISTHVTDDDVRRICNLIIRHKK